MVPVRRSAGKKRVFELCGMAGGDLETPVIVSDKVVDNVAGVILTYSYSQVDGGRAQVCQFF